LRLACIAIRMKESVKKQTLATYLIFHGDKKGNWSTELSPICLASSEKDIEFGMRWSYCDDIEVLRFNLVPV
jgi:hypothetical protein